MFTEAKRKAWRRAVCAALAALLALGMSAWAEDGAAPDEARPTEAIAGSVDADGAQAALEAPPEDETGPEAADPFGMERLAPEEAIRCATIRAAGDLMVHKRQLAIAKQSDGSYDFDPQYALVGGVLGNADYTIANLETTIGKYRNLDYSGFPMFNSPESLLKTVKDAGVDFLTLANNHMLDRYFEGMLATIEHVEEYGFDHGGSNRSPEEKEAPVIVEVNGISLGFLCYTEMTNGVEGACAKDVVQYGVNYLYKSDIPGDIQRLRDAGAEVVIAVPHWGEEYHRKPESGTVGLARRMIAAGVDVVLGSHPHMAQPVQYVTVETDGVTRRGLVAYSLGNFISNMAKYDTDWGIVVQFTLREQPDGSFFPEDAAVIPVYNWRRDGMIQAVPALKYYDRAPEGMGSGTHARLKEVCREVRDLLGEGVGTLAE